MYDEMAALLRAHQRETARISRILHDDLGQLLTAAGLHLDVLRLDVQDRVPEIGECTREIQKLLDSAIQYVRDLSYDTNPCIVERVGFRTALEHFISRADPGITISLRGCSEISVPEPAASTFYLLAWRVCAIAQDLGAQNISINIWDSEGAYVLEVLYDVSSPVRLETLTGLGVPVVIASAPGKTVVRAQCVHGLRGAAG